MTENLDFWLVVFNDDPAMLDVRAEFVDAHLAYVDAHSSKIVLAGGLRHESDTPFVGGSWLVKAANQSDVVKLIRDDPYYNPTHRKYDINYWGIFSNTLQQGAIAA